MNLVKNLSRNQVVSFILIIEYLGFGHAFKFPDKPKQINESMNDAIKYIPNTEELSKMK
jgi:hypothetical protein